MEEHSLFGSILIILVFLVLVFLAGCQAYQPPGEHLWLAL